MISSSTIYPYRHRAIAALFILLCCSILFSSARAQRSETSDSVRFKVLGCLYRSIEALNKRNVRFKSLQDELEAMHPLEPQSMDSVHFAANLNQVAKYLRFLNTHRTEITKGVRALSDTIRMLENLVAKDAEKKALENFLAAYKDESAAFIRYSQYLSVMLTDVRLAIVFLQGVPMERKGNEVTFNTDKSANEKYLDFESRIAAERMKVDDAIEHSIKLTEKENKVIQETLALFNK